MQEFLEITTGRNTLDCAAVCVECFFRGPNKKTRVWCVALCTRYNFRCRILVVPSLCEATKERSYRLLDSTDSSGWMPCNSRPFASHGFRNFGTQNELKVCRRESNTSPQIKYGVHMLRSTNNRRLPSLPPLEQNTFNCWLIKWSVAKIAHTCFRTPREPASPPS